MTKAVFLFVVLLNATSCERKPSERVLGDHGSQPPTVVTTLPGDKTPDIRPVVDSAKNSAAPLGDRVWPEPSRVVERDAQWDVWFDYRKKLVEIDGEQRVRAQMPESVKVEVRKSDLSAQLIPGR
jgi:hypothetical protein